MIGNLILGHLNDRWRIISHQEVAAPHHDVYSRLCRDLSYPIYLLLCASCGPGVDDAAQTLFGGRSQFVDDRRGRAPFRIQQFFGADVAYVQVLVDERVPLTEAFWRHVLQDGAYDRAFGNAPAARGRLRGRCQARVSA